MGKVKEQLFQQENFFGVLDHQGNLKVAKTPIRATILHINQAKNKDYISVLVKGNKKSYVAKIHKKLKRDMVFVEEGDCAWIKWKNGKAWMVGFQKRKAYHNEIALESEDGQTFLEGVDVE